MRRALVDMQQRLRAAGASLSDVRLPHAPEIASVYLAIVFAEAAAYHAAAMESRSDRYQPGVRLRLEAARFVLAEDYLRAMRGREAIRTGIDRALDGCDVLMAPTLPIEPPPIGATRRHRRRQRAPCTERDAATHPAVQRQRSPRRHASGGTYLARVFVRSAADWPARRHHATARSRPRVRTVTVNRGSLTVDR